MIVVFVVAVGVLLLALVAAATVPVAQQATSVETINDPGDLLNVYTAVLTPSHSGVLDFQWFTSNGGSVTLDIFGNSTGGPTLYSSNSNAGSGSLTVYADSPYVVAVYAGLPENVSFAATLHFTAPLL